MSRPITFQNNKQPCLNAENLNKMQDELNPFRNILQNKNPKGYSTTINGITYTINDDYSITINGTATSTSYIQLTDVFDLDGTYTLGFGSNIQSAIFMRGLNIDNSYSVDFSTRDLPTNTVNSRYIFYLYVAADAIINNVKVYPQLEEGTIATSYTPWAGYIVESGSNDNGSWIKYSDGTMICRNKKTFNIAANVAYGALFKTEEIDFPNFPVAFKDVPDISCFCIGVNTALLANWNASTKEKIGSLIGIRPVSTNAQDYIISYIAIGRWK